jgi:glycosyltransferase involved in cell wall biosynthesis
MIISAIIITRNEEENIRDCIRSLTFADEMIVVDNGSSDETVSISRCYGAKVYQVGGTDFSYLRNFGKEKSHGDFLFYLDADERPSEELKKSILRIKSKKVSDDAYEITRENFFLGKTWPARDKMIRLIRKDSLLGWQGSLHETPIVSGKINTLNGVIFHNTHRNLSEMVTKTNEWSEIEAQLRFKDNHPQMVWWRFFRVMLSSFWKSYVEDQGWRAGVVGFIESTYQAFSAFITYAKLWERQNKTIILKKKL